MTTPMHTPPCPHVHGMAPPSRPHHCELSRPLHLRDPRPCRHTRDHGHRSDARTHRPKARPWPRWRSCTKQCHGEPSAHSVRAPRLFGQAPQGTVVSCSPKASENVARDTITTDAHVASSPSPDLALLSGLRESTKASRPNAQHQLPLGPTAAAATSAQWPCAGPLSLPCSWANKQAGLPSSSRKPSPAAAQWWPSRNCGLPLLFQEWI